MTKVKDVTKGKLVQCWVGKNDYDGLLRLASDRLLPVATYLRTVIRDHVEQTS